MLRWTLTMATLLLVLLHLACVPFYAGASLTGTVRWRLEHARLTLSRGVPHRESFFIAVNSEGLRFTPGARFNSAADWSFTVPLWGLLIPTAAAGALAWHAHRRRAAAGRPPAL